MEFFATCPTGFERLLAEELAALDTPRIRPLKGQVAFEGSICEAYRVCLWSRLASRVIAVLARCGATSSDELYEGVSTVPWEEHLQKGSFAVRSTGTNSQLRTTQFISVRTKDAIVDRLYALKGARPSVNPKSPDLGVVVRVSRTHATVGIDLAGSPLFRRGYEQARTHGGLRADYASVLLALSGWGAVCDGASACLLDANPTSMAPVMEAAMQAAGFAPGLLRVRWGFFGWACHDKGIWNELVADARNKLRPKPEVQLLMAPAAHGVISATRSALRSAGLDVQPRVISFDEQPVTTNPDLIISDLSGMHDDLVREAHALTSLRDLCRDMPKAQIATAARDQLPATYLGQEPTAQIQGALGRDSLFLCSFGASRAREQPQTTAMIGGRGMSVLVAASDQFAARLKKVARARAKWARREDITCYRVYDADLPDYALSIDLYQGVNPTTGAPTDERWLQMSEYAPPKQIDPTLARSRLMDALSLAPAILGVNPHNTFLRVRRHGKGGSQYADEAREAIHTRGMQHGNATPLPVGAHLIDEGGLTFEVNFSTRLDCGIFLDHRETRSMIREMAKRTKGSRRFLNLFAYTGTATCYAADGGMTHTTTVDLSRPSLEWARRNMERNGFSGKEHEFVQADVVSWVNEQRHTNHRWDLVFCDVPTFSNSQRMRRRSFDVQRDHAELLIGVSRLLTRSGTCVFSCNLRTFVPDVDKLQKAGVALEDITAQTIPEDFSRNARIHHTYLVRRTGNANR